MTILHNHALPDFPDHKFTEDSIQPISIISKFQTSNQCANSVLYSSFLKLLFQNTTLHKLKTNILYIFFILVNKKKEMVRTLRFCAPIAWAEFETRSQFFFMFVCYIKK
jgi:hypothetical protein